MEMFFKSKRIFFYLTYSDGRQIRAVLSLDPLTIPSYSVIVETDRTSCSCPYN